MPGDVEFLDAARRARHESDRKAAAGAASAYVRRAEQALALLQTLTDLDERAAVCRIVETWLALAESELGKSDGRP